MNSRLQTSARTGGPHASCAVSKARLLWLIPLVTLPLIVSSTLTTFAASAQTGQGGSGQSIPLKAAISGTVKDQSGAALAGVRVTATDQQGSPPITTITDSEGFYALKSPAGTYTVTAESTGFEKQSRSGVSFAESRPVIVDFALHREIAGQSGQGTANAPAARPGLGGFDYYDKPEYKAGSVSAASSAGGYSSAAEPDSYDLILAYVQGERSEGPEGPGSRGGGAGSSSASHLEPSQPRAENSPAPEEASDAWNENQFFSHGSELLLHREFQPAAATFERAVARYPDSAKLETGLGVAWFALGQYDRAVKALVRATELMPSDPRPYLLLGKAYGVSSSESEEVTKRLEHLVGIQPRNAQAHYYYALSLWKGQRASPADLPLVEEHLKSALALDPQMPEAHLELGALYAQQSRYPLAIHEYRAAIRLRPGLPRAHYRLAQAYLRTGDKAAAQAELDAYQKLRGTQPDSHR